MGSAGTRARLVDLVAAPAIRSRCFGQGIGRRPDTRDLRVGIQVKDFASNETSISVKKEKSTGFYWTLCNETQFTYAQKRFKPHRRLRMFLDALSIQRKPLVRLKTLKQFEGLEVYDSRTVSLRHSVD